VTRRLLRYGAFAVALAGVFSYQGTASALSPAPNRTFADRTPAQGQLLTPQGIIVEGRGMGPSCGTSQQQADPTGYLVVAQQAVGYLNNNKATVVEISPQPGCHSISQYEAILTNITNYIEAHASSTYVKWWGGFQFNEEQDFGYNTVSLATLNQDSYNLTSTVPGQAESILQGFADSPGGWAQSSWNYVLGSLQSGGDPGNTYTAGLMSAGSGSNLVSWQPLAKPPWNSQSYVEGLVTTTPWAAQFGSTANYTLWWDENYN
jgi:hypothetical protein